MAEVKDYITYDDDRGTINISADVVAVAAGAAALEVEGVAGLSGTTGNNITEILGKKSMAKGVKITIEDRTISADVSVVAELGYSVNKIGEDVQTAVKTAVEASTGLTVSEVNVHISGINIKKK